MGGASNPWRIAASGSREEGEEASICGNADAQKRNERVAKTLSPERERNDNTRILLTADHPNLALKGTETSIVKKTPY
jgi:hypothetical protein